MRATEIVLVVPRFFLAVVVIALFGPGLDRMILVLGLTSWPVIARVVRAQTLSLARRDFVDAARGLRGASEARVVIRHVLPNAVPAAFVVISVSAASVILLEAGLGFLGLGDPRLMSWGYLMNNAQRFLRVAWWLALFPGSAIALAVLGLNLLGGYAVNDFLDPHTRGERRRRSGAWRPAGRRRGRGSPRRSARPAGTRYRRPASSARHGVVIGTTARTGRLRRPANSRTVLVARRTHLVRDHLHGGDAEILASANDRRAVSSDLKYGSPTTNRLNVGRYRD